MTGTQKCETYGHSSQRFKLASRFLPAACWLLLTAFSTAQAHDPGLSAADLRLTERGLIATLTLARTDIEQLCWIDSDRDGNISAAEFDSARPKLEELARNALKVRFDDRESKPSDPKVEIDDSNAVHFQLSFPAMSGSRLSVRSVILANLARGHKEYLSLKDERGDVIVEQMLDTSRDQIDLNLEHGLSSARVGESFERFLKLGVEHIFTGYDHLAFLFALLLAGATFREVARIISSFTLAHSLTLALATFNIVHLPSAVVEPLIAVSIIYVGVENLVRCRLDRRWLLTFAFGLVHGLGFASVLRELGIGAQAGQALLPLLSFNLGVELGQISIAALVLPLIWRLKRRPEFVTRYASAFSVLVALLGGYWLIERTLLK